MIQRNEKKTERERKRLRIDLERKMRLIRTMTWAQFHQHFTCPFFTDILLPKKSQSWTVIRENVWNSLSYEKHECKMLMKLTPGVDFINVLHTAFTLVDPKSIKRYWRLDWVLTLSGSTSSKDVRRMLIKVTPGERERERWMRNDN